MIKFRQIITVIVFCILFVGSMSFVIRYDYASVMQMKVPYPTELDANFSKQINECFIPIASIYGYTLRITSGFRTVEEQEQIYQQGRTVNGHIVTEARGGESIHNFGLAVDIVDRWREYDVDFDKLEKIGKYCGLGHGDDGDLAHFERREGLQIAQFEIGMRPKPFELPCVMPLTLQDLKNCGAPDFNK